MQKNIKWTKQRANASIEAGFTELEALLTAMIEARNMGLSINTIAKDIHHSGLEATFSKSCTVEEFAIMYRQAAELGWS